jgi:hypothetical protein
MQACLAHDHFRFSALTRALSRGETTVPILEEMNAILKQGFVPDDELISSILPILGGCTDQPGIRDLIGLLEAIDAPTAVTPCKVSSGAFIVMDTSQSHYMTPEPWADFDAVSEDSESAETSQEASEIQDEIGPCCLRIDIRGGSPLHPGGEWNSVDALGRVRLRRSSADDS